jgi:hypothetical protein
MCCPYSISNIHAFPSQAFKIRRNKANDEKVDALYECCNAFYKENGDSASTVSCPKANLLR